MFANETLYQLSYDPSQFGAKRYTKREKMQLFEIFYWSGSVGQAQELSAP